MEGEDESKELLIYSAEKSNSVPVVYRWVVLAFTSLQAFGCYFVYDCLSTIQGSLTADLQLSEIQYNMLYSCYSLCNCVFSVVGGPLVDRTTNRLGSIIFQICIVLGQFLLCLGAQVRRYWLLIIARMLLGVGIGNLTIVKNSILNLFFHGKELSLATGVTMTVARLGSVISFFISPSICDKYGHITVLYIGEVTCLFSFGCAIVFFFLELNAEKRGMVVTGQKNIRKIKIADIKTFPISFWLQCIVCGFYHANIFAMYAVIVDLLKYLYNYSSVSAGIIGSIIYFVAIPGSIFSGILIDKIGYRGTLTGICCGLMVFFDFSMVYRLVHPIILMLVAGITYSLVCSSIWSTPAVLVESHTIGTSLSIMTCIEMFIVGVANFFVGVTINVGGYNVMLMMFCLISTFGVVLSLLSKLFDFAKNNDRLDNYTPMKQQLKKLKSDIKMQLQ